MNNNQFNYTYKAPTESERKAIESIKRQYQEKPMIENKLDRLRKLDAKVKNASVITGLVLGIIGTLIFGTGLTLVLELAMFVFGIVLMVVGAVPAALAYPAYRWVLEKQKAKYGDEILQLSNELLGEDNHD